MAVGQIVVLGMHRSGTSAVVKLLEKIGLYLGESADFLPSNEGNPKGYWERSDVVNINRSLLAAQGKDWITIGDSRLTEVPGDELRKLETEASRIIDHLNQHGPWAIKDPRLSLLLPFWRQFLDNPAFVLCARNPVEVARSLLQRNELPLTVGCALWELYTCSMIRLTERDPRIVVEYQSLIDDPKGQSARLADWLRKCGVSVAKPLTREAARQVVDKRLHRQRSNPSDIQTQATPKQGRLFAVLRRGRIPRIPNAQISNMSTDLLLSFAKARKLSAQLRDQSTTYRDNVALKASEVAEIEDARRRLEERLADLKATIQARDAALLDSEGKRRDIEARAQGLEARVAELKTIVQARDAAVADSEGKRRDIEARAQGLEARVAELKTIVQARDGAVADLEGKRRDIEVRAQGLEALVAELKNTIQARDTALADLQQRRQKAEDRTRSLEARVAEVETTLQSREGALNAAKHDIQRLSRALAEIHVELVKLKTGIDKFLGPVLVGRKHTVNVLDRALRIASQARLMDPNTERDGHGSKELRSTTLPRDGRRNS